MYESTTSVESHNPEAWAPVGGPSAFPPHLLSAIPDEIDYGVIVVASDARVLYCNQCAKRELRHHGVLALADGKIEAQDPQEAGSLAGVIRMSAERGVRSLVTLGGRDGLSVAVVPLAPSSASAGRAVLLLIGKRGICAPLSADGFARQHGLTTAESAVLVSLAHGHQPSAIARLNGVAVTTVRTQIQSIRDKTGARDIRDLIRRVATLPPLIGILRI